MNAKTTITYWQGVYSATRLPALPSGRGMPARNKQRLFRRYVSPGASVLEIGCAPGVWLAWLAKSLDVRASGLDYSRRGIEMAQDLFRSLSLEGDLRCEDAFSTSFAPASFDVVYSLGVIEHFVDPAPLVRLHANLVKPGGRVLIAIPRFRGPYALLRRYFDPDSARTHNLDIMDVDALRGLAPADLSATIESFPFGRLGSSHVGLEQSLPGWLARAIRLLENASGYLQPFDIRLLCPDLVLTIVRTAERAHAA